MRKRFIVSIRKFSRWSTYDIPCFIGQKTYRSRLIAWIVFRYWQEWSMRHVKTEWGYQDMYPIAVQFAIIKPNGNCEVIHR